MGIQHQPLFVPQGSRATLEMQANTLIRLWFPGAVLDYKLEREDSDYRIIPGVRHVYAGIHAGRTPAPVTLTVTLLDDRQFMFWLSQTFSPTHLAYEVR